MSNATETTNNCDRWYNNGWIVGIGTWLITSVLSTVVNNRDAILEGIRTGFTTVILLSFIQPLLISAVIALGGITTAAASLFIFVRRGYVSNRLWTISITFLAVVVVFSILILTLNAPPTHSSPAQVGSNTPIATHSPTVTKTETLKIFFAKGKTSITTVNSYNGTITISISGVAKTSGVEFADAFYLYLPSSNRTHDKNSTLWINGQPVDTFLKAIPGFKADHNYTFVIKVSSGKLTFGVGSLLAQDKTGYFTLTLRT